MRVSVRKTFVSSVRARKVALASLFLVFGMGMASWVTRTPDMRDTLGASTAQMGLVLLGLSIGSMLGVLCSGPAVSKFGARAVIRVGASAVVMSMPVIAVGAFAASGWVVAAGLCVFGAALGGSEVALNVEGAETEHLTGRSFLPLLHGFFSLGTVIGALVGAASTAANIPVSIHLSAIGAASAVVVVLAVPQLPAATGRTARRKGEPTESRRQVWSDPTLLLIGVVIFAMALAEGTANDWLPLVLVDGHGFDAAAGSTIFILFAAAMTAGRFVGGWFIDKFGRIVVLCASALFAVLGLALVASVDDQTTVVAAVLLWGMGASLGFPVAISAAGGSRPDASERVAAVSVIGYLAFLVGPPVLGFVGEGFGLRGALMIPLAFVAAAAVCVLILGRLEGWRSLTPAEHSG